MSDNAYKLPVLDLEIHIKKGMLLKGRTISVYINSDQLLLSTCYSPIFHLKATL